MMGNYKYLFKNIGLLAISQFATKILVFLLVPLYTSVLSTAEYGTYDLFSTTVNLLIPILTLNVSESIIIYTIDTKYSNRDVISVGIKYSIIGFGLSFVFIEINFILGIFPALNQFWYFLPIMLLLSTLNTTFSYFARGIDKVKHTAISGVLSSVILITCNIIFLLVLKIGLLGYFVSHILALVVQIIYLCVTCDILQYISISFDKKTEDEMRKFSYPLIANTIGWWINNSSDRYVVTLMCGIAANGIYSVGYKIPSILNMFQSIFSQAWTISAVKDFDADDKNGFFSNMYNMYNCGMVIICSAVIISARLLAYILYAKDFFTAWKFVPWLTIAIVFGSLSGFLGGVFSAVKDSKMFGKSTVIGALINLILNMILVHFVGAIGAAIATTISFFIVWLIRLKHVRKYIRVRMRLTRDIAAYFVLILQGILLYMFNDSVLLYTLETVLFCMLIFMFKEETIGNIKRLKKKFSK